MNDFSNKKDSVLQAIGTIAGTTIYADPETYETTQAVDLNLKSSAATFVAYLQAATSAQNAAKQATADKEAARADLLNNLAIVSNVVYAPTSEVTDGLLAAIGFAPKARQRVKRPAQQVAGVAVVPDATGGALVSFPRGDNPKSAIFQIEASRDSGASWTIVGSTSATKLRLQGFEPGVTTWFRVVATTQTTAAPASAPVAIYGPQPAARVKLEVAA